MKSAFDIQTGKWNISWPQRVSRHDVVYLSPPADPIHGLPVGNGDVGVIAWCESSRLIFAVNKCDLWDDSPGEEFHNWERTEEEHCSSLRHAGRLVIDFVLPVFDLFYIKDFNARISISDGSFSIYSESEFGSVKVSGFVDWNTGAFCMDADAAFKEDISINVTLEHLGSRTFSHWYALIKRDSSIGSVGTQSSHVRNRIYIEHPLTSGTFCIGSEIECSQTYKTDIPHSRSASYILEKCSSVQFSINTVITSPLNCKSIEKADIALDDLCKSGRTAIREAHDSAWKNFWLSSLMESGDDYLDQLWHLVMFYSACSQRGKYPGRFINGLWTWNRDVQNWNFYFHWNQQQIYWPLNAAGHHDLIDSYLDYRFNSLPYARKDAERLFGVDGAFVSDVCDRVGRNSVSEAENHTPVAQIALDFWRQYRYTGNETFLRQKAAPYILAAASFCASLFEINNEDNLYHARCGTGYEGWIKLKDPITELSCSKALFNIACEVVEMLKMDVPAAGYWKHIADNMAPYPTTDKILPDGRISMGNYKGQTAEGNISLASGWGVEEKEWLTSCYPAEAETLPGGPAEMLNMLLNPETQIPVNERNLRGYDGIFPGAEYSAVFPTGCIGIKDEGKSDFYAARNTARSYAPSLMGWDPVPIVLARLGLSKETWDAIDRMPADWQFYFNGFMHYGPKESMRAESSLPHRFVKVRDADKSENGEEVVFDFSLWPFRHMGMEPGGVLACAMNESMLQSYDGVIRVAPAIPAEKTCRFTLHATGGFVVSAQITRGHVDWINVRSLRGEKLKICLPWENVSLFRNMQHSDIVESDITSVETNKDEMLLFTPTDIDIDDWQIENIEPVQSNSPKQHRSKMARLGLPKMY